MNEEHQPQSQQPTVSPPQFQQAPPTSTQPIMPHGNNDSKSKKKPILLSVIVLVILALIAFGVLFVLQTSRANAYLEKAKEFGSSVAVKQLDDVVTEFSTAKDGLYKDMYFCSATSSQILGSNDVATQELELRKKYQDSYDFLKQNQPADYKTLPLVGSFGKSAEAKEANRVITDLNKQVELLVGQPDGYDGYTGNEYSQYCLGSMYVLLSNYMSYLPQFADETTLAQHFRDGSTNAQEKLDQLALFESYDVGATPSGFDQVDKLQSEFIGGVRASLQGLLATEQEHPRNTNYLGYKHTEFANNLNSFNDSIVPEAKLQAEKYITLDMEKLQTSLADTKALANN